MGAQATSQHARSKIIALFFAIFLGQFAWIYTYKKDKGKFWVSVVAQFVLLIAAAFLTGVIVLWVLYYICTLGIYIWVIVDTARKPDAYFTQYPNYQAGVPGSAPAPPAQSAVSQTLDDDAYQALMPTKNKFALKSYYFGCMGIFPLIGLPFSILAITNGRKALNLYKTNPTPGAKIHAKVGIGFAIVELLFLALILIALADFILR